MTRADFRDIEILFTQWSMVFMVGTLRYFASAAILLWLQIAFFSQATAQTPPGNAAFERGDYSQALEIFRLQADEGQPTAQYNLGIMYLEGLGVERSFDEAADWFRRAADQGLAQAQFELGMLHVQGRGVPRDHEKAVKWWRQAAEQGDSRAQHHLGTQYAVGPGPGWGLPRDYAQALQWWRRAAEQGNALSQYELGRSYLEGRGVDRDATTGMMWLLLANENGQIDRLHPRLLERQKRRMSESQLADALRRARACRESDFSNCD